MEGEWVMSNKSQNRRRKRELGEAARWEQREDEGGYAEVSVQQEERQGLLYRIKFC